MAIRLDHVIVPSRNRFEGAKFLAGLLGVPWAESHGHFTPVYVNETLTFDFAEREGSRAITSASTSAMQSSTRSSTASRRPASRTAAIRSARRHQINRRLGGKNLYWQDADGHLWEILTVSYARPESPSLTAAG